MAPPASIRDPQVTGAPGPDRFSTAGLQEERRIELWEQHNASADL